MSYPHDSIQQLSFAGAVEGSSLSYYQATATEPAPPLGSLDGTIQTDVCIVGGGYTGLSAALHLARAGVAVTLLEQHEVGSGASGRNGGQVHTGLRHDSEWFSKRVGPEAAKQYWDFALKGRAYLDELISRYQIDAQYTAGLLHAVHRARYLAETRAHVDTHNRHHPEAPLRYVGRDEMRALVASNDYHGGTFDAASGHLHALNLARGLARAAVASGATLLERTRVGRVERAGELWKVHSARGVVQARRVLLAGNGYISGIHRDVHAHVMPLHNYIVTTEPLGRARAEALIRHRYAVSDSRFVVYYFRITPDDRLLFGGGETYTGTQPSDVRQLVRPHLLKIFPQLKDVRLEHAWGGTLAVTPTRLPYVRQLSEGLFNASGFSGLGVVLAPFTGKVMAEALLGDARALQLLEALPVPAFPGGPLLRRPAVIAALSWCALMDRF